MIAQKFDKTFEYKLIYIFRINDNQHKDCLKIGDATIHTNKNYNELLPNSHDLNFAAKKRIDEYTSTAGIIYELLHTEIAVYKVNDSNNKKNGNIVAFRDHNVHEVLKRSNIKVKYFDTNKKQNEWFVVDLGTAKNAIKCVKEGKTSLTKDEISHNSNPIIFRPEQTEAIKKTIKRFKDSDKMLWNAKMRFGKTLSALQVAKEMNFKTTIIITHRPVVSEGWYDDFKKIFYDKKEYQFGSKVLGEQSVKKLVSSNKPFVYFASIQDLRGSSIVGGKFDKNNEIFDIAWDFVVVDEAHEGTQTSLGKAVLEELVSNKNSKKPKVLELSGTPFNLLTDFEEASIYTWDYIMEQEAKQKWHLNHFGDSNPYEELPKMNIFTYHLEKYLTGFMDIEDKAFNFKEFFKTWTGDINKDSKHLPQNSHIGDFVYEKDIISFLDLICKESDTTNYPFATEEYRDFFRHTLWVLPGVKEAKALSTLLKKHHIFKYFEIVNVAGDGDEEIDTTNALNAVKNAMTKNPESTYTITLSCGRLTTGVSIPEWTAVLMLAGTYSTAASQYLQTIFRVQTPANIDGKIKENCYVFDFAPDRTLKMIAESVQLSAKTKSKNPIAEEQLKLFLNFCPVLSVDGTNMKEFKVGMLLQELKKAYAERVVKNGFDDVRLYNDELLKLDDVAIEEFEKLKKVVGASKVKGNINDIEINKEGFSNEEYEKLEKAEKKKKNELTDEEKELLKKKKEQNENRQKAISILRAISIRMPLLVYGMEGDIDTEITIDNFVDLVDELSWNEFMPTGVTKEIFKKFSKYYDKDMFISCARRIRYISKTADELEPTERVTRIAQLFATFKNPDKETVLTPWRVVNMHMSQTLGGYSFYDKNYEKELEEPRYVSFEDITNDTLSNPNANILEINSKTGLYPLYVAYSIYRAKCDKHKNELLFEDKIKIWNEVVSNNIYVICKTTMAKAITKRTLLGYRKGEINAHAFDDLINQMKEKQNQLIKKLKSSSFWKKGDGKEMKFNAIVGNPPYQEIVKFSTSGNNNNTIDIYGYFRDIALKVCDIVSLIYPAKDFQRGNCNFMDKNLVKVRIYNGSDKDAEKNIPGEPSVFGSSVRRIPGDVGIYLWNKTNPTEKIIFQNCNICRTNKIMPIRKEFFSLAEKLASCANSSRDYSIRKCCESFFVEKNPESVLSEVYDRNLTVPEGYTKVITNNKSGSGGKAHWYYIKTKDLDYIQPKVFKVVISSAFPNEAFKNPNSIDVLRDDEMFGRTKLCIYHSKDEFDAIGFKKYLSTKFVKMIANMTPYKFMYYLPDYNLIKNEIDFSKSVSEVDKQLYEKYNLSKDEIYLIENGI